MPTTSAECLIRNDSTEALEVTVEPWGHPLTLAAGRALRVVGESSRVGGLEVERSADSVSVFGWPGCRVRAYVDDEVVFASHIEVPLVPDGGSVRDFLGLVLGKTRPSK